MMLLVAIVTGAWADDSTIGRTVVYSASTESATFTGVSNDVTVTASNGSSNYGASGNKDVYFKDTKVTMNQALCLRDKLTSGNLTEYNSNVYVGFQSVVASGKKFTTKKINVKVAVAANFTWRVEIVNASTSEKLYSSSDYTITDFNKSSATNEEISITLNEEDYFDITGTAIVRLHYWNTNNSGSKYFCPLTLTLEGEAADAGAQTKYTKPSIAVGNYNASTGLYPVTLSVQNEEDGTISYKIGEGEFVHNIASGTVIDVAPEATVVAYVSGDTYDQSENASINIPAMPQLAVPTVSVGSYNFDKNTYPVTITTNEAGVTLNYTINGGAVQVYSSAIDVAAGATLVAYATKTNMIQSENVEKIIPAAPTGGTATTPITSGTYTSNVDYVMSAITVPGACIAGQISSSSTSINGSIKTRCNQSLTEGTGFYVNVNAGSKVTAISIEGCSNQTGANTCTGVYVDGVAVDFTEVTLPLAAAQGSTGTIEVSGINATQKIEFVFEESYQAQMIITVTSEIAGEVALNDVSGYNYGFAGFCAPQNFTVANGKAYKAVVTNNKIVLTELEGIVPANEGVVIAGDKGANATISYTSAPATADVTDNNLHGTTVRTLTSELKSSADKFLTLQKSTSKFIQYTGEYFPANRAYLLLDANSAPQSLEMVFDGATAVDAIAEANEAIAEAPVKVIKNGKLYIGNYNVAGQQVK